MITLYATAFVKKKITLNWNKFINKKMNQEQYKNVVVWLSSIKILTLNLGCVQIIQIKYPLKEEYIIIFIIFIKNPGWLT